MQKAYTKSGKILISSPPSTFHKKNINTSLPTITPMNFNISSLQTSGFYEFMLPFMLVTGIMYGVFHYVKSKNKDFVLNNLAIAILSTVIGLFATNNASVRRILFDWTPVFIILMILAFVFLFIQKLFEGQDKDYLPVLILLILTLAAISAYGINNFTKYLGMDTENILWALGFIIFILILWASYKMGRGEDKQQQASSNE